MSSFFCSKNELTISGSPQIAFLNRKYVVGSWYVTSHQSLTFCMKRFDSYCGLFTLRYFSIIVFFCTPLIYVNKVSCFCVDSVVYKFNFFLPIKAVKISMESISSAMKLHLIVLSVFVTSGMYILGTVVKFNCSKNWSRILLEFLLEFYWNSYWNSIRIYIGILTGEIKWI